eukprot:3830993-Lingulodinium_polyedra.AAC.1
MATNSTRRQPTLLSIRIVLLLVAVILIPATLMVLTPHCCHIADKSTRQPTLAPLIIAVSLMALT